MMERWGLEGMRSFEQSRLQAKEVQEEDVVRRSEASSPQAATL